MIKKYLVIAQGSYSDYTMFFVEKNERLTNEEHLAILNIDSWDEGEIAGEIEGVWINSEHVEIKDIKEHLKTHINSLFSNYGQDKPDILERQYSKEELLEIAMQNDRSGIDYWQSKLEDKYVEYLKAYNIYKKI